MDTIDDTGMGDSYHSFKTGHGSWTATVECMWDDTDTNSQEAELARTLHQCCTASLSRCKFMFDK